MTYIFIVMFIICNVNLKQIKTFGYHYRKNIVGMKKKRIHICIDKYNEKSTLDTYYYVTFDCSDESAKIVGSDSCIVGPDKLLCSVYVYVFHWKRITRSFKLYWFRY